MGADREIDRRARITYQTDSRFRRFSTTVKVKVGSTKVRENDDIAPVIFEVYGDGELLAKQRVTKNDQPLPVEADIRGVRTLVLLARCRENALLSTCWLNPRLER